MLLILNLFYEETQFLCNIKSKSSAIPLIYYNINSKFKNLDMRDAYFINLDKLLNVDNQHMCEICCTYSLWMVLSPWVVEPWNISLNDWKLEIPVVKISHVPFAGAKVTWILSHIQ